MAISKHISEAIQKLNSLNLKEVSIGEIKEVITQFGGTLLFAIQITPGGMVLRGRNNKPGKFFYYEKEISYNASKNVTCKMGRANNENESIFYGSLPQGPNDEEEHQVTSMIEAGLIEKDETVIHEYNLTMGKWRVEHNFHAIVLIHDEEFLSTNKDLIEMTKSYKEFASGNPEKMDDYLAVARFFSKEYSKKVEKGHEYEYKISVAFFEKLREWNIGAVVYPSVKGEGSTFNIAMHPALVDATLKLEKVAVWTLIMKAKQSLIYGRLVCLNFQNDGKFIYQDSGESPSNMRYHFLQQIKNGNQD